MILALNQMFQDMESPLINHIRQYVDLTPDQCELVEDHTQREVVRKKDHVLKVGERCVKSYFVTRGCMHMYFVDQTGMEKTVQFALENWWITDQLAFHRQSGTDFYIQAVEATELLSISFDQRHVLCERVPLMDRYFRIIYEIGYGAAMTRIKHMFNDSKEEMYLRFQENFPQFFQRVPQYLIASFLGLTPEYLSKLRGRRLS